MRMYRGKTKEGKWVYGWYVREAYTNLHGDCKIKHVIHVPHEGVGLTEEIEVIPETVGQSTGIEDSNNKEIFADDIMRLALHSGVVRYGVVKWVNNHCGFILDVYKASDGETGCHSVGYSGSAVRSLTVEGNTHDNPDLLKE